VCSLINRIRTPFLDILGICTVRVTSFAFYFFCEDFKPVKSWLSSDFLSSEPFPFLFLLVTLPSPPTSSAAGTGREPGSLAKRRGVFFFWLVFGWGSFVDTPPFFICRDAYHNRFGLSRGVESPSGVRLNLGFEEGLRGSPPTATPQLNLRFCRNYRAARDSGVAAYF